MTPIPSHLLTITFESFITDVIRNKNQIKTEPLK